MRIAAFGGPYSNPYAVRAVLDDAARQGCDRVLCLGDLGGFGAEPEAVWPLLRDGGVECIAGNYDVAIGRGDPDCGCGYRDPIDNGFAQVAYDYTRAHTSDRFAAWMRTLPTERRLDIEGVGVHVVHGSPLGLNDFFWESLPEAEKRRRVEASGADLILCTHSGLPWKERVDGALVVNVGVIGRPANDGRRDVWYALLDVSAGDADAELVPLAYDWEAQAASMRAAGLPDAFTETVETGWWTTCLQILPPRERARGRFQLYRSELVPGLEHDGLEPVRPEDPARPVIELFGSALFPRRAQLARGLEDEAAAEGFLEFDRGPLAATPDGWLWEDEPLAPPTASVRHAKTAAVQRILERAQADGRLPRAYACVTPGRA